MQLALRVGIVVRQQNSRVVRTHHSYHGSPTQRRMPARRTLFRTVFRVFGEFVLIVAGVLVALAADQYAETRRERTLEASYLNRLYEDVEATTESVRGVGARFLRAELAVRYLDSLLASPGAEPPGGSVLYLATQRASPGSLPTYFRGTLDEMESTGNLRLISDPSLRGRVLSFFEWEETHSVLWNGMDGRFRTLSRGLQYPASDERFIDQCAPDVHPAECTVDVPGVDALAIWKDLHGRPEVLAMLRHNIRDFVRARPLLAMQVTRGDSLLVAIERAFGS